MTLAHVNCSVCGRAYGAKRVHFDANYCSGSCKAKAYRERKKQAELAKLGTFDMETYKEVKMLSYRYGSDLETIAMQILDQYGAVALRKAMHLARLCQTREDKLKELSA